MIAKISATANLGGALGYNFKKVEKKEASVLLANGLYQNEQKVYTMTQVLADMRMLIPDKCRTKKMVFHCSLNPHPDEHLSDEQLTELAKEYMEALGYGKQPYIVFKHSDIAREHIHIVSLRVDENGRKINDKFEHLRSKKITDFLEQKYGLIHSSQTTNAELKELPVVLHGADNIKKQINAVVLSVLKQYSFCSLGEFNAILSKFQLAAEEVKTEYSGKQYDGLVYILTDKEGKKSATPIHASDIGRDVGYSAVQNRMLKSKEAIKPLIPAVRNRVLQVMRTSPKSEDELHQKLLEQGIRTVIRKNESGGIYGITFIDEDKGIAVNGSRLGKGYSANCFQAYFSNPSVNSFLNEKLYGGLQNATELERTVLSISTEESGGDNLANELIEELLGTPFSTVGNDDWKEVAWQRKLRKQNQMRLRRRRK